MRSAMILATVLVTLSMCQGCIPGRQWVRFGLKVSDAWTMRSIVGSGSVSRVIEGD